MNENILWEVRVVGLIKFTEFGREINEIEKRCPECGYPMNTEHKKVSFKREHSLMLSSQQTNAEQSESQSDVSQLDMESAINKSPFKTLNTLKNILFVISLVFFAISIIFFYKSYNVKNEYFNSEDYPILNKNAYVGGDAYNYIINGTYFTGYSVIASSTLLSGVILFIGSTLILVKTKECE